MLKTVGWIQDVPNSLSSISCDAPVCWARPVPNLQSYTEFRNGCWRMQVLKRIVLLLLSVCGALAYAGGTVYKWVDEQGNIQYRDTPPPAGTNYQVIQQPPAAGQAPETAISEQRKKAEAAARQTPQQAQPGPAAGTDDIEARRAAVCEQAKTNLEILAKSAHPIRTEADGKQVILTDEQRQEEVTKNQKFVEEYCKKP